MRSHGFPVAEGVVAAVCILGLVCPVFLLPETKENSLGELSKWPSDINEKAAA
jgi:hypothetical protein